jgi:esterase/lipase superfamily enzyme
MNKRHHALFSPALDLHGDVLIYGHWGRPLIAFPSQQGNVGDWESNGMIGAIEGLIEAGRLKVYCVASYDSGSWFSGAELEEAARRHGRYEDWLVNQVAPFIHEDCGGPQEILLAGASFGAYHAANLGLRRADLFPVGMCMSGVYDITVTGGGERGIETYFHNPMDYVRASARRPPGLAALPRQPAARLRAGHVGGHDRGAGEHEAIRWRPRGEGNPPRARPVGSRRPARLAVVATPGRPPSAKVRLRRCRLT